MTTHDRFPSGYVPPSPPVLTPWERLVIACPGVALPAHPSGLLLSVPSLVWRSPLLAVGLRGLDIASPSLQPLAAPPRLVRIPIELT